MNGKSGGGAASPRISLVRALEVLRGVRREDEIIIPTMGSAREWMRLGDPHALDFILVPSAMGHATSIGLGMALARPDRRVIVLSGDGSLLMNLGSLASIVAAEATNLTVVVFDNGVYEVTGQQPTAGASAGRGGRRGVDFAGVARSSGFDSVHEFTDVAAWASSARAVLDESGPTFVALDVEPVPGGTAPHSPGPAPARARAFMAGVRVGGRSRGADPDRPGRTAFDAERADPSER